MRIAGLSIRRPVFTIVLSVVVLLAGALSIGQLGVREYPSVDPPTITVSTGYPGAAAEVIQAQITEPLEEAINTVAGIKTLTSTSREGASQITAEFSLDTDLNTAASDVRDVLSRAVRNLPADTNPPLLNKADADSSPIFGVAFTSETRTQLELGAYANSLRERLQTVPGVASVDQPAEKRYAMRLWMDPEKLAAYNVSPLDVRQAIARENIEVPSGRIEGATVELPIKTLSRLNTPAEFNDLVIRRTEDRVVRFSDIGHAVLGAQNERGALKLNATPIAGLYFRQQPGANQIEIVDELRRRLEQISKEVPADIRMEVAYDNTQYVRRSLVEVTETILLAFILVVMVVFVFLREWRTTLIPILAIPVSIVGAFWIMHVAGFSINTLTLLALVLAIGIVVDDAIVVLENIYARIEAGMSPVESSITGTREIFLAIIATTITLTVVFLPLLFMGGQAGRLFREFGMTLAGAVLISAAVALTLTPMLCSRLLRRGQSHGRLFRATEPLFRWLESSYARSLARFMRCRWLAPVVLVAAAVLGALVVNLLPRELAPLEDRGRLWVRATAPEGTSYDFMQSFMDDLAKVVNEEIPEATVTMTQVPSQGGRENGVAGAVNNGFVRVFLEERSQRGRSQQQIVDDLQSLQGRFTGARINITQEPSITGNSSQPGVRFVIQGATVAALREVLPKFLQAAGASPVFTYVDSDLKFSKPEVQVSINRDRAQTLGVSAQEVAQTLQAALSGQRVGYFVLDGKQYDVIAQLNRDFRSRPSDLENIPVRTAGGVPARLGNLISFSESSSPPELYRYNRYSSATVSATLASGYTLADGIAAMEEVARTTLDDRFTTSLAGAARDFRESSSALGAVFVLAVVLIYLVLAAQFESFVDPLVILFTVPLALAGAVAALWIFGQTLNLFSQIGLIMLVGLVTKNGILIVEFARQRRTGGRPAAEAVQEAAAARFRPILMTTLATVLGILPIALALGAGSETRVSMGIAVIGGLVFGCALTLYVIPAMYCLFSRAPRGAELAAIAAGPAAGSAG